MRSLHTLSIRWKLTAMTMLTSTIALAVACAVFATYDTIMFRRAMVHQLAAQADLIEANSTAALAFDDRRGATEVLRAFVADARILAAFLYKSDGQPFARYVRADAKPEAEPSVPAGDGYGFAHDGLEMWHTIVLDGDAIGRVYLRSDLREMHERVRRYAAVIALVMVACGLVAFVLSSRLQRLISEPIGHLVETATAVSARHDYSLRAVKRSADEVGTLIDRFNEMLSQIEHGDRALHRAHDQLELRVDERTAALRQEIAERERVQGQLETSKEAAESATHAKSAFLANVSHEIRTPMNVIIGMTEMALDADLPPVPHDYLTRVRANALGLLAIINDILDCSRIEAGKMTLQLTTLDLPKTMQGIVELLGHSAEAKGLELACVVPPDLPAHLRGDPVRIRQVLTNLVGNAVKFTPAGGITLAARVLRRTDAAAEIRLEVRDTGIGIPPDRQAAIFESFTQADEATTRTYGGTGLGLTIARQLVELMDGRIGVESEPGKGSTFWIEVPFAIEASGDPERRRAAAALRSAGEPPGRVRVLKLV